MDNTGKIVPKAAYYVNQLETFMCYNVYTFNFTRKKLNR